MHSEFCSSGEPSRFPASGEARLETRLAGQSIKCTVKDETEREEVLPYEASADPAFYLRDL